MEAQWNYHGYEGNGPIFKNRVDPERSQWLRMAKVVSDMLRKTPWVRVTDRLPKFDQPVIICLGGISVTEGYFHAKSQTFTTIGRVNPGDPLTQMTMDCVTHWADSLYAPEYYVS